MNGALILVDARVQNQMISSEVTVLFEKACQSMPAVRFAPRRSRADSIRAVFIQELTARSHMRSLAARRRMISRADVAAAVSRSDMFDFLIVRPRLPRP